MIKKYNIPNELKQEIAEQLLNRPGRKTTGIRDSIIRALGCGKTKANEIIRELQAKEPTRQMELIVCDENGKPVGVELITTPQPESSEPVILDGWNEFTDSKVEMVAVPLVPDLPKLPNDASPVKARVVTPPSSTEESKWSSALEFKEKYVFNPETDQYVFPSSRVKSGNIVLSGGTVRDIQRDYSNYNGEPATLIEISRKHQIPKLILTDVMNKLGITHESLPVTDEELKTKDKAELLAGVME